MNRKEGFFERAGNFLAGKGFYIVLFLCVAVIGASAWAMITIKSFDTDDLDMDMSATVTNATVAVNPNEDSETVMAESGDESESITEDEADTQTETQETAETTDEAEAETTETETISVPDAFTWPVSGDILTAHSTDTLIYDKTMGDWRTHAGVDISAGLGDQVLAISSGTVECVYSDDLYGTTVVINHGDGLRSIYSNLAETPTVSEGDSVITGAVIGAVGETAIIESGVESHLHLEATLNGEEVDPAGYLP